MTNSLSAPQTKETPPAPGGPAAPPPPIPLTPRVLAGVAGMYIAAMMGGLNSRVGSLGLDDLRGVFGFAYDDASWITSFYAAGELIIMPFVPWLVSIFSIKRLETAMLIIAVSIALILPFIHNLYVLMALRFFQGMACGSVIFMFMISLFFLLPGHIRMYGFGFYAMVATFTPNIGVWLTAFWTDTLHSWEFLYWHSIPLGIVALLLVRFGMPATPTNFGRIRTTNWPGMAFMIPGGILLALALSQGVRLDWFNSPFITWALTSGLSLLLLFVISELNHSAPFLQLRVFTSHRNVWMSLLVLLTVLVVTLAGTTLPVAYLGRIWGYRALHSASVGLILALPQFVIGPIIAFLLYRRWLDARAIYILGLLLLVMGCVIGSRLDGEWTESNFYLCQVFFAFGLPAAIISTIYVMSNNVVASIGPSLGGAINTMRCLGTLMGTAVVGQHMQTQQHYHYEWLRDKTATAIEGGASSHNLAFTELYGVILN